MDSRVIRKMGVWDISPKAVLPNETFWSMGKNWQKPKLWKISQLIKNNIKKAVCVSFFSKNKKKLFEKTFYPLFGRF